MAQLEAVACAKGTHESHTDTYPRSRPEGVIGLLPMSHGPTYLYLGIFDEEVFKQCSLVHRDICASQCRNCEIVRIASCHQGGLDLEQEADASICITCLPSIKDFQAFCLLPCI
jgi:hypothetical protein